MIESEEASDRYYQVVSQVRRKIRDELSEDVELLADPYPELLAELQDVVCDEGS